MEKMTEKELKKHIYELTYALDTYSASKNYDALRRMHYNNIAWLQQHGLGDEYYKVWFEHFRILRSKLKKEH